MTVKEIFEAATIYLNPFQSFVVIVGGGFLAVQVYLQLQQSLTANYLALMDARNAITLREMTNPELRTLYSNEEFPKVKNLKDWTQLSDDQQCLYLHLGTVISVEERTYVFRRSRAISKRVATTEFNALEEIVRLPIFKNSWSYLSNFYREDFVKFVNELAKSKKSAGDAQRP